MRKNRQEAERMVGEKTNLHLPLFMQGEPLPEGYFEPHDPYKSAPSCKVKIGAMAEYARTHGKKCSELTREEFEMFKVS